MTASPAPLDFARLPLTPAALANLQLLGYTQMTPIQAASLPIALLGKDLIAQAKTGSGKTAAFALALLANLIAIVVASISNFVANDRWTFRRRPPP